MNTRFKSFLMAATIILFLCLITAAPVNVWFLITSGSYTIPAESTIFSFEPTLMNNTAENLWTYGKDNERFYHCSEGCADYLMVSRADAILCAGFNEHDFKTWCTRYVLLRPTIIQLLEKEASDFRTDVK
jgi:hypothetical protein